MISGFPLHDIEEGEELSRIGANLARALHSFEEVAKCPIVTVGHIPLEQERRWGRLGQNSLSL